MNDNIQRKVLTNNPLKTNYIPNTTHKPKSENQKRFSNISKQKHTIQKNTTRYNQQIDIHGSATIMPQKSSSKHSLYTNQNNNYAMNHNRGRYEQQVTNLNMKSNKSKSPIDKQQVIHGMQMLNIQNHHTGYPLQQTNNNIPRVSMQPQGSQNNKYGGGTFTIGNNNKGVLNIQLKTQRQSLFKTHTKQPIREDEINMTAQTKSQSIPSNKIKSMLTNRQLNAQQIGEDDDLRCNQQLDDLPIFPTHQRKLSSNNFMNLGSQSKLNITSDEFHQTMINDNHSGYSNSDFNTRTQKKQPSQKPLGLSERNKSQNTLSNKQPLINNQLSGNSSSTMLKNPTHNASKPHLNQNIPNNPNFSSLLQHNHNRHNSKLIFTPSIPNYQQQLRKFQQQQQQINTNQYMETIFLLQNRAKDYMSQPNYIELRQKNFNWSMRALLIQWMAHVCQEFRLKRATFYIALTLADKYLENTNDLPKAQFQLVGAACMFIASKLEEFQCLQSAQFSKSTNNRYSALQIRQTQFKICKVLNYQLNPPTLFMWANSFMLHWDNYIEFSSARAHPYFITHQPKYFKKGQNQSYMLFRQLMQLLDCSILDIQTLQFVPKILICSFMYLVLGRNYKQWSLKRIIDQFPRRSHYLVSGQQFSQFNDLFHMFLYESFGLEMIEILPAVQYCSTYFGLQLNFDPPLNGQQSQNQMTLEQYESYQTYNPKMHEYVKKRDRRVYLE